MEIGDTGYLAERLARGRGNNLRVGVEPRMSPPVYKLEEIQKCKKLTMYVVRSVVGNYPRTITSIEFEVGDWTCSPDPYPISQAAQRRQRLAAGDLSVKTTMTQFNKGGFI